MKVKEKIWTYEDIDKIPEHSLIINGKEVPIMASSGIHGRWQNKLSKKLDNWYDKKYRVFVGEIGILISRNPLIILGADIVLVSRQKLEDIPQSIIEVPPDLVIEIEKEKEEIEFEEKINHYLSINIPKQIWVMLSKRKVLVVEASKRSVYSFDDKVEILEGKKIKFSDIEKEVFGDV